MTTIIYALLLMYGLITGPEQFEQLPESEQQEMLIIIEDITV